MRRYTKDPRATTAMYNSQCAKCGEKIHRGAWIFYYPLTRTVLCEKETCGKDAAREFAAYAFDEDNNRSM